MEKLDKDFWDFRYQSGQTGWNIGYPSTPIKEYIDQLTDKDLKILIPGTGNSYEAEYLFNKGFKQVYVADISKYPLENFKKRVPDFPEDHLLHIDFYEIDQSFDLVIEQTFFCAQFPAQRSQYVDQMHRILNPKGKLVGLLFNFPFDENSGPPYGGNEEEYRKLFSKKFDIQILEPAYNSIKPRMGHELFIHMTKK